MNKELLEILLEVSKKSLCRHIHGTACLAVRCPNCILRRVGLEQIYPETIKVIVNE